MALNKKQSNTWMSFYGLGFMYTKNGVSQIDGNNVFHLVYGSAIVICRIFHAKLQSGAGIKVVSPHEIKTGLLDVVMALFV